MENLSLFNWIHQNQIQNHNIIKNVNNEIAKIFDWINYFSLIYGSYPNWTANNESDLDIVVGTPKFNPNLFDYLQNYIVEVHHKHNLWIDNEIPYTNKLLVSYDEFHASAKLHGLVFNESSVFVPEIQKTPAFLSSPDIKHRLIFNTLTVPTIYSWNDSINYSAIKNEAEDNLVMLAIDLSNQTTLTQNDLLQALLLSKDGKKDWELYLWYKNIPIVIEYLKSIITNRLYKFNLLWLVKIQWNIIYPNIAKIKTILEHNISIL